MAEELIEGALALASTLDAGVTPYLLSCSLGAVGVEHSNDDNVDAEADFPDSAAENSSEFISALIGLWLFEWFTETTMT